MLSGAKSVGSVASASHTMSHANLPSSPCATL